MRVGGTSRAGWRRPGRPRYAGALTPRQQDVFELLATGLTNEEIAQHLGITPYGVKYHVAEILRRLGVENRHDAVALHLRTENKGWLAAWAPVIFLHKLPLAWLPKAAAGAVLTAVAAGIAVLAWGVLSTSSVAVTTNGCSVEQAAGGAPPCAPGVAQAAAGAGAITAISAGMFHSCALKDGGVWCWGGYFDSDGVTEGSDAPSAVPGLTSGVSAISSGIHSCALQHGGVWCCGAYPGGVGGLTVGAPVEIAGLTSGVSAISSGGGHSCALRADGVWCWEQILYGGASTGVRFSAPSKVPGLESGVTAISAAQGHNCALKDSGAWCWEQIQIVAGGQSNGVRISPPVVVPGLASGVSAISAAAGTCALKDDGVLCWGVNGDGELGNNSTVDSLVPVAVSGLASGVSAIDGTCAVKEGGVWCWGDNRFGQLGNNSRTASLVPVAVSGLATGVSTISAGSDHTCALKDGGVLCWGVNGNVPNVNNSPAYPAYSAVPVPILFPPPSTGDVATAPDAKPSPSQPSTDSADHRTAYVLASTAAAALAILAAGTWAVRRRRRNA